MNGTVGADRQFGVGPLARVAAFVHTLLVVELLLLATAAPGLVPLVLLDRDASNVPLAAACVLPLGPAVSAALFALHHRRLDLTDLKPAAAFWRGYRLNAAGALRIWVPALAWLTIVAVTLANRAAAGIPGWWVVLLVVVAVAVLLWSANALVITSLFAFRAVDVARLAAYFLGRTWRVTLGNACLLVVAAGITAFTSEAVLALVCAPLVLAVLHNARPMVAQIRENFVA